MELKDLNTELFYVDPKSKDFLKELEKHEEFKFDVPDGVDKKSLCAYIALCYDPNSEIRKTYKHYPTRKRIAAMSAGFETNENGKFSKDVEDYLVGENHAYNAAIIKYLSWTHDLNFMRYHVFEALQYQALLNALNGDPKGIDQADKLTEKQTKEGEVIFGGEEVHKMRKALSQGAAVKALDTPEDYAFRLEEGDQLDDCNPYGDRYKIDKLRFLGDEEPDI